MQNLKHEEFLFDIYEFVKSKFRKTGVIAPAIIFIKDEECTEITPVFFTDKLISVDDIQEMVTNYLRTQYPTAFILCALLAEHKHQEGELKILYSLLLQYNRMSCPLTTVIKGTIDMNSVSVIKTDIQKDIHISSAPLNFGKEE